MNIEFDERRFKIFYKEPNFIYGPGVYQDRADRVLQDWGFTLLESGRYVAPQEVREWNLTRKSLPMWLIVPQNQPSLTN
jgi:hypothetical protein